MKKQQIQNELRLISDYLRSSGGESSLGDIYRHVQKRLDYEMGKKTLQRRLLHLSEGGLITAKGERKARVYAISHSPSLMQEALYNTPAPELSEPHATYSAIFSAATNQKLKYLDTPVYARTKSTYSKALLTDYMPNQTQYVPQNMRDKLHALGQRFDRTLAAGTYAKQISQRLLIDLSFNSSRLEGNTYTKLDTQRLIEQGLFAEGKAQTESIMIMNHKEAIKFIIENAETVIVGTFAIRNIHYFLSQDLLLNPNACGREREIEVSIASSAYQPLSNFHQIQESLSLLMLKVAQITDPFEQSFFLLIHLSYLQAFEDVNKRTARLMCNIPFVQQNLCPLSFTDVPQEDYLKAMLYFYERKDISPALELFCWAYEKSCKQYSVLKDALGDIDPYRIQTRAARKKALGSIIKEMICTKEGIESFLRGFCSDNDIADIDKFLAMTCSDLRNIHSGAIVGLGITEAVFERYVEHFKTQFEADNRDAMLDSTQYVEKHGLPLWNFRLF